MTPQKQLITHNPSQGVFGDCYRTAVAVVIGEDAANVPHVCAKGWDNPDDLDGIAAMREFLKDRGLAISQSVFHGGLSWHQFKDWMGRLNPDVPLLVTGQTARGTNHVVVMLGEDVVCDPFTGDANQEPFTGPSESNGERNWWVEVITPAATIETHNP